MASKTFIIDCHWCKAKVAAEEKGRAESDGLDEEAGQPYGHRLLIGVCPSCESLLVGEAQQTGFKGYDADENEWGDVVRVYPKPPREFSSFRIPKIVKNSLLQADRSLQANANDAACVMLGRALEALCRDVLQTEDTSGAASSSPEPKKKIMLGQGIKKLREKKIIDDRLYDWSQQLQAFRNLAAHPEDTAISRTDAEDLQTFVYAIVEYVYDLTDRYNEFKERIESRERRKKKKP
jgi:Domain of unknown function (DUF4145)